MAKPGGWKFGWKRKVGDRVSLEKSKEFSDSSKNEETEEAIESGEVDWLTLAPKRRGISLEDAVAKCNRLKDEAELLAQNDRNWEAIKKIDEALQFIPKDEKLYEMKAQALMCVNEVFPASAAARKAIDLNPLWWIAYQTYGRTQLNMGEVKMALSSFSRAIHLNPASEELWTEDLLWSYKLLHQNQSDDPVDPEAQPKQNKVYEIDDDGNCVEVEKQSETGETSCFVLDQDVKSRPFERPKTLN